MEPLPSLLPDQRYTRQMAVEGVGDAGQQRLRHAHVLIVGLGGLGTAAARYLAGAGVGTLTLADHDHVSLSNLHRQILYGEDDVSDAKTDSAQRRLKQYNSTVDYRICSHYLQGDRLQNAVAAADLVLDGTDNAASRHALNHAAVKSRTPWIYASAAQQTGQLALFAPPFQHGCYHCLFPALCTATPPAALPILGPVAGIIGTMQALEALHWLTGASTPLRQSLAIFEGEYLRWHTLQRHPLPSCPVCGVTR